MLDYIAAISFHLSLANLLVDFHDRYPDRVFLIMGNRDINKLRLLSELSDMCLEPDQIKICTPQDVEYSLG